MSKYGDALHLYSSVNIVSLDQIFEKYTQEGGAIFITRLICIYCNIVYKDQSNKYTW